MATMTRTEPGNESDGRAFVEPVLIRSGGLLWLRGRVHRPIRVDHARMQAEDDLPLDRWADDGGAP